MKDSLTKILYLCGVFNHKTSIHSTACIGKKIKLTMIQANCIKS